MYGIGLLGTQTGQYNSNILMAWVFGIKGLGCCRHPKARTGQIHRSTGVLLDIVRLDVDLGSAEGLGERQLRARIGGSGSGTSRWLVAPP